MATAPLAVAVRKILCLNTTTLCYFAFSGETSSSVARALSRIGTCERQLYAIDMCGNILLKFTTCEDSREEFSRARSKSSEVAWAQIWNSLLFFFHWITVPLLSHLIRVLAYQRKLEMGNWIIEARDQHLKMISLTQGRESPFAFNEIEKFKYSRYWIKSRLLNVWKIELRKSIPSGF